MDGGPTLGRPGLPGKTPLIGTAEHRAVPTVAHPGSRRHPRSVETDGGGTRTARRRLRPRAAMGGLVLALVLGAVAWRLVDTRIGDPQPFVKPAAVDGAAVTLDYVGSQCQSGSRVEVDEHDDRVVLTVWTWSWAAGCSDVGVGYRVSTTLDRPLGTRLVVDGACLRPRYERYLDCRRDRVSP